MLTITRKLLAAPGLLAALLALLVACGDGDGSATDARLSVVTTVHPVAEVAAAVGGDLAEVINLTPAGAEPHDVELNPRQIDRIADSDLLLYLGGGFQPAVDEAAARVSGAVDLLEGLSGAMPGDPHVWLDPVLFAQVTERVAAALAEADPGNSDAYGRRATELGDRLAELHDTYRSGLESCERRVIVTSHEAFGYLADRYGLEELAVSGLAPEAEPDPRRLAELADLVRERGITTVFTEELVSPRVGETLAREAGVSTAVLYTLEGAPEDEDDDYFSLMRENLDTLRTALDCA